MKFTTAILALAAGSAAAFAPSTSNRKATSLNALPEVEELPGALAPFGFFDPLGLAEGKTLSEVLKWRESEVTHGRVGMLAVLGFLVGEAVEGSSFLFDASIKGPAIDHLQQVPTGFFTVLTLFIGFSELYRATSGWLSPNDPEFTTFGQLREGYVPGDIGFDPLGLKPDDLEEYELLQAKELQNGRLAMLAAAGFIAQELVNHKGILENLQG